LYVYDPALDPGAEAESAGSPARFLRIDPLDARSLDGLASGPARPVDTRLRPEDPATINFTSGTTGEPKGVTSTHRTWCRSVKMLIKASRMGPGSRESVLHGIPLATAGWGIFLPSFLGGMTNLLAPDYEAGKALELIERERVTRAFVTPSQLADWLDHPSAGERDLSSLSRVFCGTAPLYGATLAAAQDRLGRIIQGGYGMAEVLPPVALWDATEQTPGLSLRAGRLADGVSVRVLDAEGAAVAPPERGELWIRSPTQTVGYWRRDDLTRASFRDGYFRTGDLGFFDTEGFLNVVGRLKDRIPRLALHPREVEERAYALDGVKECALVEVDAGPVLGYSVRRGHELTSDDLQRWLEPLRLERPVRFERLPQLPRSAAGKVVHEGVRRLIGGQGCAR
jgi:fatty-acyl-CoA synthase